MLLGVSLPFSGLQFLSLAVFSGILPPWLQDFHLQVGKGQHSQETVHFSKHPKITSHYVTGPLLSQSLGPGG
jgi:hypothetical protein